MMEDMTLYTGLASEVGPHTHRFLAILEGMIERSTQVHQTLLENQSAALQAFKVLYTAMPDRGPAQVVFSRQALEEFAAGSIARCFGSEYVELDKRPAPRIPNGRLLLIDRVTEISGTRMQIQPPAGIVTEVDVPQDAWYLEENPYSGLPLSILMEMALQPCGILSAFLGTSLVIPPENHQFRNLDGWIRLHETPDLSGRTITNRAQLIKSVASGGLYLQTYRFSLSVDDQSFLEGESSFGYFTPEVMGGQSGLDQGARLPGLISSKDFPNGFLSVEDVLRHGKRLLDLSDRTWVNPSGGKFGLGVAVGESAVGQADWFFANHFHGDPVMPGSLGVEAVICGLSALVKESGGKKGKTLLALDFPADRPLRWKYRGQVLPTNRQTVYELHINQVDLDTAGTRVSAQADFWVDGLRIYTIENLSLMLKEG
jgi:3-hydroxymyristoyl/3-hydroxydecanoyl-(acyl carrier protein) dehydratase